MTGSRSPLTLALAFILACGPGEGPTETSDATAATSDASSATPSSSSSDGSESTSASTGAGPGPGSSAGSSTSGSSSELTGDPCENVGCGLTPLCDEGCQEQCGCSDCPAGELACGSELGLPEGVYTCSADGSCWELTAACEDEQECQLDADPPGCLEDLCAELETEYAALLEANQGGCVDDLDCTELLPHCQLYPEGGCGAPIHVDGPLADLIAIEAAWVDQGCFDSECGVCVDPPPVICDAGTCAKAQ